MTIPWESIFGIAIAALGGAAVGPEREWSGHASGPEAHFAGIRTFTLLGGLAGATGWFWTLNFLAPAIVLLDGAAAVVIAPYVAASRKQVDGAGELPKITADRVQLQRY